MPTTRKALDLVHHIEVEIIHEWHDVYGRPLFYGIHETAGYGTLRRPFIYRQEELKFVAAERTNEETA
jgi:hypothetical protein